MDENIIKISGVPNPTKLDHSASAYIMLDVDPKEEQNVSKSLFSCPEVHFIMMLNKRSGMIICVHMTDTASLYEFLKNKVAGLKGVTNTETFVGASVKKTYYGWLVDME